VEKHKYQGKREKRTKTFTIIALKSDGYCRGEEGKVKGDRLQHDVLIPGIQGSEKRAVGKELRKSWRNERGKDGREGGRRGRLSDD